MLVKCNCNNCSTHLEFESANAGQVISCPTCGMETTLYVPTTPSVPKVEKPAPKAVSPARLKIPTGVWIGIGVFVLCVLCVTSIIIGKNLQKRSEQTVGTKSNLPQFLQNLKEKSAANKKPDYPAPPTSGMEFTANLLKNFPERVEGTPGTLEGKFGWMDGEYFQTSNDEINSYDRADFDTSTKAGFTITDKNGEFFEHCYVEKSKLGDTLLSLKSGDRIRIIGQAIMVLRPGTDATFDIMFRVDSIQLFK